MHKVERPFDRDGIQVMGTLWVHNLNIVGTGEAGRGWKVDGQTKVGPSATAPLNRASRGLAAAEPGGIWIETEPRLRQEVYFRTSILLRGSTFCSRLLDATKGHIDWT